MPDVRVRVAEDERIRVTVGGGGGGGNMTLAGSVSSWASLPASPSLGDVYHFTGDYTHAKGFYVYDGTSWAHVGEGVSESDVQDPLFSDDGTLALATADRHFVTNEYGVLEVNIDGETITAGYDPASDEFSNSYQVRVNPRALVDDDTLVYDTGTDRIKADLDAIANGVNQLIDYRELSNKPDVEGIASRVTELEEAVAAILSALESNGIHVDWADASVSGTTMSLSNASVSGRTLSVDGVVSGTTLSL